MPVIYQKWITRKHLQDNPDQLYLFGDNLIKRGYCAATPLVKQRDIAGGDFGGSGSRA